MFTLFMNEFNKDKVNEICSTNSEPIRRTTTEDIQQDDNNMDNDETHSTG